MLLSVLTGHHGSLSIFAKVEVLMES